MDEASRFFSPGEDEEKENSEYKDLGARARARNAAPDGPSANPSSVEAAIASLPKRARLQLERPYTGP